MFDYTQKLQLALTDSARRASMKVVAGVILAIGASFLLAALWSWLAHDLGWGPALASLAIGGGLVLIALIVLAISNRRKHVMPTGDDLRDEVETRLTLLADAATDRVRFEANKVLDTASNKVHAVMDNAQYRANKLAGDAERRAYGVARSVGLTSENLDLAKDKVDEVKDTVSRASNSNAGSMVKLVSAFAIGVTLAAKLRESRSDRHADDYDYNEDDFV